MMRLAISPRLAISSLPIGPVSSWAGADTTDPFGIMFVIGGSHPEHAEAAAPGDRARVHGRQGHAQHGAGVPRVDDAVVVQPRADEEGVRLGDRKSTRLNSS